MNTVWNKMPKNEIQKKTYNMNLMCNLMQYVVHLYLGNKDIEYRIQLVDDSSDSNCDIRTDQYETRFICILSLSINPYSEYNVMQSEVKKYNEYFKSIHIPEQLYDYATILFVWLHEIGHAMSYYEIYKMNGIEGIRQTSALNDYSFSLLNTIYDSTGNIMNNNIPFESMKQFIYSKSYSELQADIFVYRNFINAWDIIKEVI